MKPVGPSRGFGWSIRITAANCTIENLWLISAFTNGITIGIQGNTNSEGTTLRNLIMEESLVTQEFLTAISFTADVENITIEGLQFWGILGGGDLNCINFDGLASRTIIRDCMLHGDWSASVIDILATASVGLFIDRIVYYQDDTVAGLGIDVNDSSTGMMTNCQGMNRKDTVEGVTGDSMGYAECRNTNVVNKNAFILPALDT